MKKINFLLGVFILSCTCLQAQSKWYMAPAAGAAYWGDSRHVNTNLTVGRAIGENNRYRIDVWGSYTFNSTINNVFSTAALFTWGEYERNRQFITTASIGAGISKTGSKKNMDFIIPVRANFGYRFTDNLSLGVEFSPVVNLSDPKGGTFCFTGLFIGIRP